MTAARATEQVDALLATPDLPGALESEQFKRFLDQVPTAIVVSDMRGSERIAYANPEFERLSGQRAADIEGRPWSVLQGHSENTERKIGAALEDTNDWVGTFHLEG